MTEVIAMQKVKGRGQRSSHRGQNLTKTFPDSNPSLNSQTAMK